MQFRKFAWIFIFFRLVLSLPNNGFTSSFTSKASIIRSRPPRPAATSQPPDTESRQCGEIVTVVVLPDSYGVIQSPGYPNSYNGGLDCEWRIIGDPATQIQATIFDLRIQDTLSKDVSDFLYLSLSGNWSDIQRFSGDVNYATPMVLVSEGSSLFVRFKTSRFTDGDRGFRIAYYATNTDKPALSEPAHDVYLVVFCNYVSVHQPQIFPEEGISRDSREIPSTQHKSPGLSKSPTDSSLSRANPHPYLVALILDGEHFCSGTLVSDRHILTSAHCTKGVHHIRMVFGTDDISLSDVGVQQRVVNSSLVTEHPNFDPFRGDNDLSIIELDKPLAINKQVIPAVLPAFFHIGSTFSGYKGEVVGWGDSQSGQIENKASKRSIRISPNAGCKARKRGHNGLSMCSIGVPGATCQADAGSPIVATRAYCNGPVNQENSEKPPRPQTPVTSHNKPSKPSKPGNSKPHSKVLTEVNDPKYQANVLIGIVSYGTCDTGFSFIRITAYLDFITKLLQR